MGTKTDEHILVHFRLFNFPLLIDLTSKFVTVRLEH